jgi:hypothetical protein
MPKRVIVLTIVGLLTDLLVLDGGVVVMARGRVENFEVAFFAEITETCD